MSLRKIEETVANARSSLTVRSQPPYHSDISDEYLTALQAQVDATKSQGFKLTSISEAGW